MKSLSVRCDQGSSSKSGPGLDVWLSRGAMLAFFGAVGVELTTGKGVLQVTNRPPRLVCVMPSCMYCSFVGGN